MNFFFNTALLLWFIALVTVYLNFLHYTLICTIVSAVMFALYFRKAKKNKNLPMAIYKGNNFLSEKSGLGVPYTYGNGRKNTIIFADVNYEGDITSQENIYIYGSVQGNVTNKNGLVKIHQGGKLEGEIFCRFLIVNGEVRGNCQAQHIDILENGIILGNIIYMSLSLKTGGAVIGELDKPSHFIQ